MKKNQIVVYKDTMDGWAQMIRAAVAGENDPESFAKNWMVDPKSALLNLADMFERTAKN